MAGARPVASLTRPQVRDPGWSTGRRPRYVAAHRRIGASVTIVPEEVLEAQQYRAVEEALRAVPGVDVQRSGSPGKLTTIRIRGANATQVQVLIDGIRVKSLTSGDFDFADLARVLFRLRAHGEIAEHRAPDFKAAFPDGLQVCATRNEGDVVPDPRQLRTVVPANCPRSQNRNLHQLIRGAFAPRTPLHAPSLAALARDLKDTLQLIYRREYMYTGTPSASRPRPAMDSTGRSNKVFNTNAPDPRTNSAGTTG